MLFQIQLAETKTTIVHTFNIFQLKAFLVTFLFDIDKIQIFRRNLKKPYSLQIYVTVATPFLLIHFY